MKVLSLEFGLDGRTLQQLQRSRTPDIYELFGAQGLLYGYEVIKIVIRKESEQFGTLFPERESYPSSSQFGKLGWLYGSGNREQAFERFDKLVRLEGVSLPVYRYRRTAGTLEEALAGGIN